jgi:hypothetical protein
MEMTGIKKPNLQLQVDVMANKALTLDYDL